MYMRLLTNNWIPSTPFSDPATITVAALINLHNELWKTLSLYDLNGPSLWNDQRFAATPVLNTSEADIDDELGDEVKRLEKRLIEENVIPLTQYRDEEVEEIKKHAARIEDRLWILEQTVKNEVEKRLARLDKLVDVRKMSLELIDIPPIPGQGESMKEYSGHTKDEILQSREREKSRKEHEEKLEDYLKRHNITH